MGTFIGLTAAMLAVFGGAIIFLFSIYLGTSVHGGFVLGVLLVPLWLAVWFTVTEWAADF